MRCSASPPCSTTNITSESVAKSAARSLRSFSTPVQLGGKSGRRALSYQALYNLLGKLELSDLADTLNA